MMQTLTLRSPQWSRSAKTPNRLGPSTAEHSRCMEAPGNRPAVRLCAPGRRDAALAGTCVCRVVPAHHFGDLLRQYRLAAGLTQEGLAERAGLSVHGIQKLERGATHPFRDTASRLERALQLEQDDRARLLAADFSGARGVGFGGAD